VTEEEKELAAQLEEQILGGEFVAFACGCALVAKVCEYNAAWILVDITRYTTFCNDRTRSPTAPTCSIAIMPSNGSALSGWRTRTGGLVSIDAYLESVRMYRDLYGEPYTPSLCLDVTETRDKSIELNPRAQEMMKIP
jgi:hypothetical protein